MKNLLYIFILLPVMALGQTTTQNYVKTLVYKDSTATSNASMASARVTYYDGLGRPVQQIAHKQSGDGKDIVTHVEYDGFGRQPKGYLPYASTMDNMAFDASAQVNTVAFYNTGTFENTANPYSEQFFEASPLGRVMKQGAPGTPWLGNAGNDNDHTVKFAYLTNTSTDAVKNLSATAAWNAANEVYDITFVNNGTFAAGKLYKTITQDENKASTVYTGNLISAKLNTTEEYKNQLGQLILKRTFNALTERGSTIFSTLDTYYVYDQFGNLTYVLPPLANGSNAQLDALCYQYKYDHRNRMVEKKLPGKGREFLVYDNQDRVVATGPALQPWGSGSNGWMITKYDVFGRVAYTGWYSQTDIGPSARKLLQANAFSVVTKTATATTIDNIGVYYTNSFPTTMNVLAVNYYDNYTFSGAPTTTVLNTTVETQPVLTNVKGLPTGSWVRALLNTTNTTGDTSYILYDKKGRPISAHTTNYLGGYTQTSCKLDFDGTLKYTKTTHRRSSSSSDLVVSTQDNFTYTAQHRLLSQTHTIGSQTQLMAENTYNNIGQLTTKKVGNTSSAPLQKVDYTYNVRGWLKSINDVTNLNPSGTVGATPDLFAFKINYNNAIEQTINGMVVPLYNGNIAETSWRTASDNIQRRYGYTYDNLNRLNDAWYQIPQATVPARHSYDEHLRYDNNGNITALWRNGEFDSATTVQEIDDLTYTYSGNQLMAVADSSGHTAGFNDLNTAGADYTYDVYGNMLTDKNKGITTSITYNHLNLPVTITVGGTTGGTISYLYNAAGIKLRKTVTPASGTSVATDYLGGYQYVSGVLEFFPTSEGYVKHTLVGTTSNYNYVFQYKDHVGNNRISYTVDPNGNVLKILEEDHYYPFGLKHNAYSANQQMIKGTGGTGVAIVPVITPGDVTYKYMYNGKELQDELGINNYDFGARNYDPAIGRWMNIDPLAELSRKYNPYNYCYNNPIVFTDPDGMHSTSNSSGNTLRDEMSEEMNPTRGYEKFSEQSSYNMANGGNSANNNGEDPDPDKPGWFRRMLNSLFGDKKSTSEITFEEPETYAVNENNERFSFKDWFVNILTFQQTSAEAAQARQDHYELFIKAADNSVKVGKVYHEAALTFITLPIGGEGGEIAAGLSALEREGLVTITNASKSKIHANIISGNASQVFKSMFPAWDGVITTRTAGYATSDAIWANGVRGTLANTSSSTGMSTIKLLYVSGFQVILRFPAF